MKILQKLSILLLCAVAGCSQQKITNTKRGIQISNNATIQAATIVISSDATLGKRATDTLFSEIRKVADKDGIYSMIWSLTRLNDDINGHKFSDAKDSFLVPPLPFQLDKSNARLIFNNREKSNEINDMFYDLGEVVIADAFLVPAVNVMEVGSTWSDSITGGRVKMLNSYKIDKIEDNIALVTYSGKSIQKNSMELRGAVIGIELNKNYTGTIQLSLESFLVLSNSKTSEENISMNIMGQNKSSSSSSAMHTTYILK